MKSSSSEAAVLVGEPRSTHIQSMENRCSIKGCFGPRGLVWFVLMIVLVLAVAGVVNYFL